MTSRDPFGFGRYQHAWQAYSHEMAKRLDVSRQMSEMVKGLDMSRQMAELTKGLDVSRHMEEMAKHLVLLGHVPEAVRKGLLSQQRAVDAVSQQMLARNEALHSALRIAEKEERLQREPTALEQAQAAELGESKAVRHEHPPAVETVSSVNADDRGGPQIVLPPGTHMLAWASRICPKKLVEQFLEPIIADYQHEHIKALASKADEDALNEIAGHYRAAFVIAFLWALIKAIGEVVKTLKGAG